MTTTRFLTPTPTVGNAPSHSPPDNLYAPGINLSRALGWFSIGLGLAEVLAPRALASATGVRHPTLLQAYGLREIVCGLGVLSSARPAGWMWARVAGDALDLATIGASLAEADGEQRGRGLTALVAVAGVAALDMINAGQLTAAASLEG